MTAEALRRYKSAATLFAQHGLVLSSRIETFVRTLREQPQILAKGRNAHESLFDIINSVVFSPLEVPEHQQLIIPAMKQGDVSQQGILEQGLFAPSPSYLTGTTTSLGCALWFNEQFYQLLTEILYWQGRASFHIDLPGRVRQTLLMLDNQIQPLFEAQEYQISRRNLLIALATVPFGSLVAVQRKLKAGLILEEFLPQCTASMTACWYLMQGREFEAVEHALANYLPLLVSWAQRPSPYQQTAAYLASQGALLMGLLSLHQLVAPKNFQRRLVYCTQAVECARVAKDTVLLVTTLAHLGNAQYDMGQLTNMLRTYQHAINLMQQSSDQSAIPVLLKSKLFAEFAHAYAQQGHEQETLHYIGEAREVFPLDTGSSPIFLSTDYGEHSLILFEGLVHLDLSEHCPHGGYQQHAERALAQVNHVSHPLLIPERFRVEIVNHQALAAVKVGNMESFLQYTTEGVQWSKNLHSEKRMEEIRKNWKKARELWPHEQRLSEVLELLI
jgi:tetratricopeptide (TPR) repeat protein